MSRNNFRYQSQLRLQLLVLSLIETVTARPLAATPALAASVLQAEGGHFDKPSREVSLRGFLFGPHHPRRPAAGHAIPREDEHDVPNPVDERKNESKIEEEIEEYEEYEKRKWLHVLQSRTFFDWFVFAVFATIFLMIYHAFFIGLPTATKFHGLAIIGWVCLAMIYNSFMYMKFGREEAMVWLNGYLLEIVFSLENVFVFHVIIEAFGTPTDAAQKCLFLVVCFQVLFELVLYMGLADVIDQLGFLHYVLGAWLSYLGVHVACDTEEHSEYNILDTFTVRAFRTVLGDSLDTENNDHTTIFIYGSGKLKVTLLGLVFLCLLGADFVLEIDVTLTKMEQTHDEYQSFTSSALAGFAVPELFFVARDLFKHFQLLKYGISFVLIFYGVDMLFPSLFTLSPIEGCGLIMAVLLLCILVSIPAKLCARGEESPLKEDLDIAKDYGTKDKAKVPSILYSIISDGSARG